MEVLLLKYGYLLLFLGVAVEGEAFLLAGALLAHRGLFHLPVVIAVAVAANTVADQVYYVLARSRGRAWLERRYGAHPRYQRALDLMTRHGRLLLVASRYAFGFRILIPAACGALGMPLATFLPLNVLAGVAWALPTALVGYYASVGLGHVLLDLRRYELLAGVALVLVPVAYVSVRHLRRVGRLLRLELRWSDLHLLAPFAMGLMGVLNLASAVWPRSPAAVQALERWLPLEVMQRSRPLTLFAGVALLQVTGSLSRRKAMAWWVALAALGVSLLSHLGHAFDLHHSLVAGLLLAYLLVFRRRFHARSDPTSLRQGLWMAPVLAGVVLTYGYVGLATHHSRFAWQPGATPWSEAVRSGLAILDPQVEPLSERAARFLGSLQIAGWMARFYLLVLLLRPVILRDRLEAPAEWVAEVFRAHGRRSLSAFAVQPDKHHQRVAGGRALVAYAVRGSVALGCGDPLAPDDAFADAAREFFEHCRRNGWTGCVYEAAEERLPVYHALGLRSLKMAEEALVDLPNFSLAGGRRATLRAMVHKVTRAGLTVSAYRRGAARDDELDEQLEEISEEWLAEKRLGELGFTLGRFSLEALDDVHVFVCRSAARVEAFCTFLPYRDGQAAVLDLMRKRRDAASGTMDLLIAQALLGLKEAGLGEASLANAPLANVGEPRTPLDRGVALLFENLNAFYGYKHLFQFKKKFAPDWQGRYLVYPQGAELPRIAWAMTRVHGSGGLRSLLRRR